MVAKHLQNIFHEGELDKDSTCAKIAQVQTEGQRQVTRNVEFYNLDAFLKFNEREVLDNPGKASAEIAKVFAVSEWEKYRIVQDRLFVSDFDKEVKKLMKSKKRNYE